MRTLALSAGALCAALSPIVVAAAESGFTAEFPLQDCSFVARGGNDYFDLSIGRQLYLSNQQCVAAGKCEELTELWITVLNEARELVLTDHGQKRRIRTRVVEEKETSNGKLAEVSRNFFATCRPSHDVYYFGEEVDIYEDGNIVSHEGEWLAGQQRAQPGIMMPASGFILGMRYFQERAPGIALDRAEHVATDVTIQTPAGKFHDCIRVAETTPLEPDESIKVYCPHVGLVVDDDLILQALHDPNANAH